VNLIPDYVLKVENAFAWVLDAKSPHQKIIDNDNVEQVFSYAIHPEIRSSYFALCNGLEFAVFRTMETAKPELYFRLEDIDRYWPVLQKTLSPDSFQAGNKFTYEKITPVSAQKKFDYNDRPLLEEIPAKKRAVKRHFGVHGYFTRQSWDIVSAYIKNYSREGDLVLDPFGGSGVTAVEALMNGRKAVNIDLNPMAVFIVRALLAPAAVSSLMEAYGKVTAEYIKNKPKTEGDIAKILETYPGPKNLLLPKGSDVETVPELFSREQTAQLALLKAIIKKEKNKNVRDTLLLIFSGVITRVNLTYHVSTAVEAKTGFGGDASAMRYYRYRIAPNPTNVDVILCFESRFKKVAAAKKEIEQQCLLNGKTAEEMFADAQIIKGTAADLSFLPKESVDYIYTDPPYGKKIPYLDLSVMWNAWLDLEVTEADYAMEAIEGGEHHKTKEDYNTLIAKSIEEMYRVLRFDRWLSFVFAHKDPEFWHLIIETCEKCGFEYSGAVPQKNGQTSFKKRQHPFTVLSGQLIINFRKTRNPRTLLKGNFGMDIDELVMQTVEGVIAKEHGAALEQINDELIIKGLEKGFLDLLKKHYADLTPLLLDRFDYDADTEKFKLKKNKPFQTHVDEKLRIKYYLQSFLQRNGTADFDKIVLEIMPLLKNGREPEDQTILGVLSDIGERVGANGWKLKTKERTLFDGI
jgi:16S rRNA G966 N2-methylase RsmD